MFPRVALPSLGGWHAKGIECMIYTVFDALLEKCGKYVIFSLEKC